MALAVVYAMLASYAISRTLVPILAALLLKGEERQATARAAAGLPPSALARFGAAFDQSFERLRDSYEATLTGLLASAWKVPVLALVLLLVAGTLVPRVGQDFFPSVDAGEFRLHVRAAPGSRLEVTERLFDEIEDTIREVVPESERNLILDNIGMPFRYDMPFDDGTTIGTNDGQITVFYFQPDDIVTQILNFGLPAQIDVRVAGYDGVTNRKVAAAIQEEIAHITGVADVHLHQELAAPELQVNIDRDRAGDLGLTTNDVARDVMVSLASSSTVTPNFWVDPKAGIPYPVAVQTPPYQIGDLADLRNTVVGGPGAGGVTPTLLGNVTDIRRHAAQSVISHSNIQPTLDIYASAEGRDLGSIATEIDRIVGRHRGALTPGNTIEVLAQIGSMRSAFEHMGVGLAVAALAVYLLMAVNFQSFADPFVVILGLPGAMAGIVFMLFITGTTFSVPSLMGAIMSVGVASANSILLVTFAKEQRAHRLSALEAASAAGRTRLRPILMTSLAMVIGMLPMALGLGDGGEQNAPLGRAVIGGLLMGTVATLFLVPWLYSRLRKHQGELLKEYADV